MIERGRMPGNLFLYLTLPIHPHTLSFLFLFNHSGMYGLPDLAISSIKLQLVCDELRPSPDVLQSSTHSILSFSVQSQCNVWNTRLGHPSSIKLQLVCDWITALPICAPVFHTLKFVTWQNRNDCHFLLIIIINSSIWSSTHWHMGTFLSICYRGLSFF